MDSEKKVVFFTKGLRTYAYFSLFMTIVIHGVVAIFNFSESFKLFYYSFYTLYNFIFIVLILIRIPYYKKSKRNNSRISKTYE